MENILLFWRLDRSLQPMRQHIYNVLSHREPISLNSGGKEKWSIFDDPPRLPHPGLQLLHAGANRAGGAAAAPEVSERNEVSL